MIAGTRLGDVFLHQVIEQEAPFFDIHEFFPALTDDMLNSNRAWLEPHFLDPGTGRVVLRIQSYVLQCPRHTILIDPCVGNHKPRPARSFWHMMDSDRYLENFAAIGLSPNDIDYVMCTHLHGDHVGWNTRLANGHWVPTFPNAKYLLADRELAHWTDRQRQNPASCPWMTDSVLPIVEAGLAEIIKSSHALNDHVRLMPTPGHTIDHFSVLVGRSQTQAIVTGDMFHSPLQAVYPALGTFADYDSKRAGITRLEIFDRYCDTSTLFCTAHFPVSSVGRIVPWRDTFKFVPISAN